MGTATLPTQANAGRTVIDQVTGANGLPQQVRLPFSGYCAPDLRECSPTNLPFAVGSFSQFIFYSNGSISLGNTLETQLTSGGTITSLAELGRAIIAPAFSNGRFFNEFGEDGAYVAEVLSVSDALKVSFYDCRSSINCKSNGNSLILAQKGSGYSLTFDYFGNAPRSDLSGFFLNGTFVQNPNLQARTFLLDQNLKMVTDVPAVPEPATWAMMLIGFGAVGGALRRRRLRVTVTYS